MGNSIGYMLWIAHELYGLYRIKLLIIKGFVGWIVVWTVSWIIRWGWIVGWVVVDIMMQFVMEYVMHYVVAYAVFQESCPTYGNLSVFLHLFFYYSVHYTSFLVLFIYIDKYIGVHTQNITFINIGIMY